MINEKKVKLMTKVAIEEQKSHNEIEMAATNFKADYITVNMVYVAITTTIGYIFLVLLWAMSDLEKLLMQASGLELPKIIESIAKNYFICLGVFLFIALIVYSIRYDRAVDKAKKELTDLKNIAKYEGK